MSINLKKYMNLGFRKKHGDFTCGCGCGEKFKEGERVCVVRDATMEMIDNELWCHEEAECKMFHENCDLYFKVGTPKK